MLLIEDIEDYIPENLYFIIMLFILIAIGAILVYWVMGNENFNFRMVIMVSAIIMIFFGFYNVLDDIYIAIGILMFSVMLYCIYQSNQSNGNVMRWVK